MLNEVIYLITTTEQTYDDDGFLVDGTEARTKVFAECKSTTYSEYNSSRVGEQATDIFVVNADDYNRAIVTVSGKKIRPSLVEYDGDLYRVTRRYKRQNGSFTIELSCVEVE